MEESAREQRTGDIRPRLTAEELVEQFELVSNNIASAVIISQIGGQVTYCTPYTEVLTGYALSDIMRDPNFIERLCVEEDLERLRRAKMIAELGEDSLVRFRIKHRCGLRLWIETRFVPVFTADGEIEAVLSSSIDVTASVTYQRQIEEQNRDLSDFAYMVSHDLKAPIFTIKGMAAALNEDLGATLGTEGQETVQFIVDAATRLERLIASVLEYSAASTNPLSEGTVDLGVIIENVRRDLGQQIRDADAEVTVDPKLPAVRGESVRLYQVFSNLIGNALKYRSPERRLHISITSRTASNAQQGGIAVIDITDNGLGVPKDKLEDIFRPYHRAHNHTVEGNGIGLACVKKIIERLHGTVTVRSKEGSGSTFTVTIPVGDLEPQSVPPDLARCFEM